MRKLMVMSVLAVSVVGASAQDKGWESSISLGVNTTDGNSDTLSLNAGIKTEKKDDVNAWRFGADGQYGEVESEKNNENAKGYGGLRHVISGRTYGLIDATLSYDAISEIDYRFVLSPGLGYYLVKSEATSLGLEVGPAWVAEKVAGETDDYVAVRVGETFTHQISKTAKIWQSAEYLPSTDDFEDDYLLNAEVGIEAMVNSKVALRLVAKDAYDSTPAAGRERNDLSVLGALVYTL